MSALSFSRLGLLGVALAALFAAPSHALTIDHTSVTQVSGYSQATMDRVAQRNFFFAHASVGSNIMEGIRQLHSQNPSFYELSSVRAGDTPPATTKKGVIYEYARGNPGWQAKVDGFSTDVANGWRAPTVDFLLNKFCYIDEKADVSYYLHAMQVLEQNNPQSTVVYMTMPLTTGTGKDNVLRNQFNTAVRQWASQGNRVLFDVADIEAWDSQGQQHTFVSGGVTYQQLYEGFSSDGGHLNSLGSQRLALGFYAVAAVPEPSQALLLLLGLVPLVALRRARSKQGRPE